MASAWRTEEISQEIQAQSAKACALQKAVELGATHISWIKATPEKAGHIKARAYKCKKE
jgi:hypothetical protein